MSERDEALRVLEGTLATALRQGTRIATGVVAAGLLVAAFASSGRATWSMGVVNAGILLFIMLPTARVVLMMLAFLKDRDYRFAAIAAGVLTIIVLGLLTAART